MMDVDVKCRRIEQNGENENIESAKCELIKDEKIKIEYYFANVGNTTMYPKRIDIFRRNAVDNYWNQYREIEYQDFRVQWDGKQIINNTLPIGLSCMRKNSQNYHSLTSPFYHDFYFDYNFNFTYLNDETKELVSKTRLGSLYAVYSPFRTNDDMRPTSFVSWSANEEFDGKYFTTFYDQNTKTFYDHYEGNKPGTDKCYLHSDSNSLNWFYFQDLFVKNPDIFDFAYRDYSYLGDYEIDGKISLVFEKTLGGFSRIIDGKNDGHSKNMNGIFSDEMIATYYYDYPRQDRFSQPLTMPYKMELRLKGKDGEKEVGNLILDIKKYYPGIMDYDKVFEPFSNCIKEGTGYNQISVKYTDNKDILDKIENKVNQIRNHFRESIHDFISPLR